MSKSLYGYAGKLLRMDLGSETTKIEKINSDFLREFLGGSGYAKLLYDELPKGIDPLNSKNKLMFTTGPLTGTRAPGSGFASVCFKSPLTGLWADSKSGGEWGGELKRAGYDLLIVENKAKIPVYLVIEDDVVKIKPAKHLQGKTTSQKDELIRQELGDEGFQTAVIGPAGENMVRFANVMVKGLTKANMGRAFGRCGAGAVMGSKNLHAIAVKGNGEIPVAKPGEFSSAVKEYKKRILTNTGKEGWAEDGTTGDIPACDEVGDFPTKNWRSNSWGEGEALYDHFKKENLVKSTPCYKGCILQCGRICQVVEGEWKTPQHEGGEYESISAFTAFVLNENVDAAVHADYLCNEYGLDTISTGAAIAFAMDCFDQGILGKEETRSLELKWGNAETIIKLVKKIAKREGLGKLLGEGVKVASEKLGGTAQELAIHVKGLEGPAHDPRSGKTLAPMYGTNNRGMCHIHPLEGMAFDCGKIDFGLTSFGLPNPKDIDRFAENGKGKIAKTLQDFGTVPDIVGICKFYIYEGLGLKEISGMVSSLTGWNIGGEDLLSTGERVFTLQRMFNIREGVRRRDDMLPKRVLNIPEFGAYSSKKDAKIQEYLRMLDDLYKARRWNLNTGIPTDTKLSELGLTDLNQKIPD